jgi:hypothetical protein
MCTRCTMFTSNVIRKSEPKIHSPQIGRRGTCFLTSLQCRVTASATPRQFPALPRQFPAMPRQFPAAPRQSLRVNTQCKFHVRA